MLPKQNCHRADAITQTCAYCQPDGRTCDSFVNGERTNIMKARKMSRKCWFTLAQRIYETSESIVRVQRQMVFIVNSVPHTRTSVIPVLNYASCCFAYTRTEARADQFDISHFVWLFLHTHESGTKATDSYVLGREKSKSDEWLLLARLLNAIASKII